MIEATVKVYELLGAEVFLYLFQLRVLSMK